MSSHDDCKGCNEYSRLSRRNFLGLSASAAAFAMVPGWLPRVVLADEASSSRDVLVSLFLRGGADSLTLCVPHGEDDYYQLRPGLAIPRPDSSAALRAIDLDGFFGLPPALQPLMEVYQDGALAIVHACGLPDTTRSHFDAMHMMEVGMDDPPATLISGWLGRHLQATAPTMEQGFLRAVGIGAGLPRTLVGGPKTLPIGDLETFGLAGDPGTFDQRREALEAMYAIVPDPLGSSARNTFGTIELLEQIDFASYQPAGGAEYPEGEFGTALRSTAAPIKADVGVEAVSIDLGGWDTHELQGPTQGQMSLLMADLAAGLAAFHEDLFTDDHENVIVTAMSEFGRNAIENGSAGTDHGYGGAMLVLGGAVNGGRVIAEWPGLAPELLYEGQDLQITTDYRDVLTEILTRRLDNPDFRSVFSDPSYEPTDLGIVG
ncbi:MAG: DUF1501 domain-containing protein [bacterium]|nr:DUF1501 domain-containing protein [bacterium]